MSRLASLPLRLSVRPYEILICMTEQERFENEINNAIAIKGLDKVEYSDILVCKNTPQILLSVGLKDLPILLSRKHLYMSIKEKNYKKHYKGLQIEEHIYKIPNFISDPAIILRDTDDKHTGDILIVANAYDKDKFPIVISIKANSTQMTHKDTTECNYMITILGYNHINDLVNNAVANKNVLYYDKEKIQEIDQFTGKKVSNTLSSLESNIILQQF